MRGIRLGVFGGGALVAVALGLAPNAEAADPAEWGDESAAADERPTEPSTAPAGRAEAREDARGEPTGASESVALSAPPDESSEGVSDTGAASPPLLGLRYRGILLPKAVLDWFIDGGQSVYVSGFGPEFSIRDENVEYIFSAWLALYDMSPLAIKGKSDAEEAWEIVESEMKSVYLTFDYLWHTPLAQGLELSYGGGAGLGFMFGNLYRTQATLEPGGNAGDPDDFVPCEGVNTPAQGGYCDDINDHYDGYGEPNWLHGGAKPVLYPWVTGQIGLRYQPHAKLVTRFDLGLGTSGLFFGVGADYAL